MFRIALTTAFFAAAAVFAVEVVDDGLFHTASKVNGSTQYDVVEADGNTAGEELKTVDEENGVIGSEVVESTPLTDSKTSSTELAYFEELKARKYSLGVHGDFSLGTGAYASLSLTAGAKVNYFFMPQFGVTAGFDLLSFAVEPGDDGGSLYQLSFPIALRGRFGAIAWGELGIRYDFIYSAKFTHGSYSHSVSFSNDPYGELDNLGGVSLEVAGGIVRYVSGHQLDIGGKLAYDPTYNRIQIGVLLHYWFLSSKDKL